MTAGRAAAAALDADRLRAHVGRRLDSTDVIAEAAR